MEEALADAKREKRIMHYTSNQKILLVSEGNFSFASCLAKAFGSAKNMVATSLDSRGNNHIYGRNFLYHFYYFTYYTIF